MRYEDASQSGSFNNDLPVARDDADALPAGDRGPETGNVISGDGTQTGSVGADLAINGAKVVEVEGAGGSDSEFAAGKLSVNGEYGKLTLDAQGNYSYLANQGAPETARDHFTYKLADDKGNSDTARLTIEIGKTQAQVATQQVVVGPDGVVVLPAGVELSDIRVVGRDLVVTLPDGSLMVIVDGAVFVPQLVINDVAIPATNLASLLIDNEPQPAAGGSPPSGGGNFAVPVAPLDPGVPLGDLIPPTELDYTPPELEEVGIDEEDPNEAPFALNDTINLSEEGLTADFNNGEGLEDTAGTPDTTDDASVSGSINAGDPDGDNLTITLGIPSQTLYSHGTEIEWVLSDGNTVLTGYAGETPVIVMTMQDNGDYTVVLSGPIDHDDDTIEDGESFVVPVNVSDGEDSVNVNVTVTVEDDSPRIGEVGTGSSVLLDETDGANPVSSGAPIVVSSAGAMIVAGIDYGADGQGPAPVYGLSLLGTSTVGSSILSNVQTALGDLPITLTLTSSTLITATYQSGGTQTAFTIQMNANGTITVTQFTALEHLVDGPPGPAHDDALSLVNGSGASLINATILFQDFDGDKATASTGIGGAITFEDDGPSINIIEAVTTDQEGSFVVPTLDTGDDGTEGEGFTTDSTSADFSGYFTLSSNGGGDGAATTPDIVYSLNLLVAEQSDSGLDSHGQTIYLYNVGGVVVGSTSATEPASATHASVVFSLSVDANGVVTSTQYQQIDHPIGSDPSATGAPFTDHILVLGAGKVEIVANATITDNDGDTASDTERFDLGAYVRFADDGPAILTGPTLNSSVLLDETDGANPVSSGAPIVVSSSGAMIVAGVDYGADGQGPAPVYGLTLLGTSVIGSSIASNLQTALGDLPITLTLTSSTLITATYNGGANTAFTIQMNANGTITVTQFTALEHLVDGPPGPAHDDALTLDSEQLGNLVNATVTYQDYDGDTVSTAIGIGGAITFEDDGPSIDVIETVPADQEGQAALVLTTGDAGTEDEGFTSDSTSADFGGVFSLTSDGGGDGTVSTPDIVYSLGLQVTEGTDSGLNSHGQSIYLYNIGGVVVGSTSAVEPASATDASVVFALSIDGNGVVTSTQYQQVDHADEAPGATNAPFADQLAVLNTGLVEIIASATITDNDGDTDSDEERFDLGNYVRFADDGPAVTGVRAGSSVLLDETDGGSPLSSGAPISATSASAMLAASVDYGADGQGPAPVYGLSLLGTSTVGSSIATTLQTAAGNFPITLTLTSATLVTATYQDGGTQTAFTVQINPNGTVTVTQYTALEHGVDGPPGPAHDDALNLLNASDQSWVNATVTYEDFDGDTATASVGIGGAITFKDDGPNVDVNEQAAPDTIILDETRPEGTDTTGGIAPTGDASATANFADNFGAVDYGADGPGSASFSLYLSANGIASGLYALDPTDTLLDGDGIGQGSAITLSFANGIVTGSANSIDYFTISIDSTTGVVTFTQLQPIWHGTPGASHDEAANLSTALASNLQVRQSVVDSDGDTDVAAVNIGQAVFSIQDDGPDAAVNGSATLDTIILDETRPEGTDTGGGAPLGDASATANFADNFAAVTDYGSDGPGSTAYSLFLSANGIASGLFALDATDTETTIDGYGQGSAITLSLAGGVVTGSANGTDYFTISVDSTTGVVTFTQLQPIWHGTPGNSYDEAANLSTTLAANFQVRQTVTDADGDTDVASVNVGQGVFSIQDDGPNAEVNGSATLDTIILDETRPEGTDTGGGAPLGDVSATANFADNFAAVTDYGSDGAGSTAYSLFLSANGIASGLFALDATDTETTIDGYGQGSAITLSLAGGVVTGSANGIDYFTISINSSTGVVTFTQLQPIWHGTPGNSYDEAANLSTTLAANFQVVQTVTDADGDVDTASVNVGQGVFSIQDDGPNAEANGTAPLDTIILDETRPEGTDTGGGLPNGDASATANFADNFAAVTDYGSDGAGSTVYSLFLSANGIASGLFALDATDILADGDGIGQGAAITLSQTGNIVTGSAGGIDYFTISIDSTTGVVTFTQLQPIWHGTPDNSYDEAANLSTTLAANFQVRQTVTDADGDIDVASVNIGQGVFSIQDDGPDAAVNGQAAVDTIVIDESRPEGTDTGGGAPLGDASATANFADNFAPVTDYGSDGAGSTTYSLLLSLNGIASGLYAVDPADTETVIDGYGRGTAITLSQTGNIVTGSANGVDYFTLSINSATGVVTFTQLQPIWHPTPGNSYDEAATLSTTLASNLQVVQTVKDADGDVDSASINVGQGVFSIQDDGPSAVNDLDTIQGGAGPATGNVITGTDIGGGDGNTTDGNADDVGVDIPGTITRIQSVNVPANIDTSYDGSNNLVVNGLYGQLTINKDGSYSYTRTDLNAGGVDDVFTYTLTDADGDTVTATLTIAIEDNFPTAGNVNVLLDDDALANGIANGPGDRNPDTQNTGGTLPGSGGDGTLTFGFGTNVAPAGYTYDTSVPGQLLIKQGGITVITVTIAANGTYSVVQNAPLSHPTQNAGPDDNTENNVSFTLNYTVKDGDNDFAIPGGTINIDVDDDTPTATVNGSATLDTIVLDETRPEGTDTGGVLPNGDASATANFADNFAAVTAYGADGPGSTAYSLFLSANGIASGLFALDATDTVLDADGIGQGAAITLSQTGNIVTGSAGGMDYFTISIDSTTGVVTFTQLQPIWHGTPGNSYDEAANLSTTLAANFQVRQTVTDSDGDSAVASVNVGQGVFSIQDDGPDAAVNGSATLDTIVLDETRPEGSDTTGGIAPTGDASATANFADNFAAVTDYGSDGPGSTVYSLFLSASGIASGLFALDATDTVLDADGIGQGAAITLSQTGNIVTGSAGGVDYFTISIAPGTGVVTFTQLQPIWHGTPGNSYDEAASLSTTLASNLQVRQTVTDADGDTDMALINIGQGVFSIQDDGPDAAVNGSATLDTIVLDESRPEGTDTTGGASPTGDASASAAFADNFAAVTDYGSDGAGATSYALLLSLNGIASGLFTLDATDNETVIDGFGKGVSITLSQTGNIITGSAGGVDYFTISIAPTTGVVTFTQLQPIWHPTPGSSYDEAAALSTSLASNIQVVQTVRDADGDTDTASINIGQGVFSIQDDGPTVTAVDNEITIVNDASPSGFGDFAFDIGADVNTDFDDISLSNFSVSVNGTLITDPTKFNLTPGAETAAAANYTFSFTYANADTTTATATGTLVFHKTGPNAGQYEVVLTSGPIEGFTILDTGGASASAFVEHSPQVTTASLSPDFHVQFTGVAGPNSTINYNLDTTPANDATPGTFTNGELLTASTSTVQVSSSAAGVGGNTLQGNGGEVLNFNLYSTNPLGVTGGVPTASSSSMFLTFDTVAAGVEDMIIILKLYDTVTGEYTTRAVIVSNTDLITGPRNNVNNGPGDSSPPLPSPYQDITLDNNDGFLVIESNDYNGVGENFVIVGAQIAGGDSGIIGTGINFNPLTGAAGGSSGTQAFSTDSHDGPFKITSVGFLTESTEDQYAELNFNVTVTDADGDTTTEAITVNIGTPPAAGARLAVESSEAANDTTLFATMIANDNDQEKMEKVAGNAHNKVFAAAVAAAGFAASDAAAEGAPLINEGDGSIEAAGFAALTEFADGNAAPDTEVSRLLSDNESREAVDENGDLAGPGGDAPLVSRPFDDSGIESEAPADLLEATEAAPAAEGALIAPLVSMPAADEMESLAGEANEAVQHSGTVEKILAEALEGGAGDGGIDAILAQLGGENGDNAALEALATQGGGAVPGWDMGLAAASQADAIMNILSEAAVLHQDAVQPAING